jgi:antitoxin MazE
MQTHIQKWGNSLGIRIPMKLSQHLNLKPGSVVNVLLEGDHLIIHPQKYQLEEMLSKITPKNCHHEIFTDSIKGQEEW